MKSSKKLVKCLECGSKMKEGGIHIKPENKGKFTEYCGGSVSSDCIKRGKNSPDPAVRKRATFSANARKWKHENGGEFVNTYENIEENNTTAPLDNSNLLSNFEFLKKFLQNTNYEVNSLDKLINKTNSIITNIIK